ncbi:hypothetical protein [uncultured Corynebacterium sp.]|uniref:hypothetical protein n=1 Tax=uncultured Corynebacterium sp. TaxID=159447 RepID=UPI0025F901E6|nr:hypothetical protein [uncultured Corynebacterium sp.]
MEGPRTSSVTHTVRFLTTDKSGGILPVAYGVIIALAASLLSAILAGVYLTVHNRMYAWKGAVADDDIKE